MAIDSIGSTALQGIQRGFQGLQRTAADVASSAQQAQKVGASGNNLEHSLVELPQHANQVKASSKALEAYQDSLGSLLDVRA